MILRLRSGSVTPARAPKNRSAAFTWTRSMWNWRAEGLLHLVGLAGPHQAGVDEDTGQLVADGLVDQGGRHRRVDPARQGAQHPVGAHLGPHGRHLGLDDRDVGPRGRAPADVVEEALEQVRPRVGVYDLGVELDAVDAGARGRRGRPPGPRGSTRWPRSPAGTSVMASPWLIQTSASAGQSTKRGEAPGRGRAGCGRTRPVRCGSPCPRAAGPAAGPRSRCPGWGRPSS